MKVKYIPAKRCARIDYNISDEVTLREALNKTTYPFKITASGECLVGVKNKEGYCNFVKCLQSVMNEMKWFEWVDRIN